MSFETHDINDTSNDIAIIGMSCRFPGCTTTDQFWKNLILGKETITHFSSEELEKNEFEYHKLKDRNDYVGSRGILENIEMFDASFFGISPSEASSLDPQHRLWFECAWEALEDAAYNPDTYDGLIGVFTGTGFNSYLLHNIIQNRKYLEELVRRRALSSLHDIIGNSSDFLPTRTSYLFNLKGPSINVQTACSTSLVAFCQACQSLLNYDSDICIAGGVSLFLPQIGGYFFLEGGITSPDGHCKPYSDNAKGTVFSNGAGAVVIKRFSDAINDEDNIYAVVKGYALSNDGCDKVSFSAPSVNGQTRAIKAALDLGNIDPNTIVYVEGHGTATPLGDPVEVEALSKAFRYKTSKKQFCALGSVKGNVGHLDAASGIAGLIKTVLVLKNKQIPPTLHFLKPNPEIDFEQSPFYVNNTLLPLPENDQPRRAGVSSFGIGGTNAHVVLQEYSPTIGTRSSRKYQLLPFSAKTGTALEMQLVKFHNYLESNPQSDLADSAYTLKLGRKIWDQRGFLVCNDVVDAVEKSRFPKNLTKHKSTSEQPSIIFMFPGQGSQHIEMGKDLYENEPVFRYHMDYCSNVLKALTQIDLIRLLYPEESEKENATLQLNQTGIAQPSLFIIEYSLARLWIEWGVKPKAMIGHSVGEYVAACLAEIFSVEDALLILANRAKLMQKMPAGAMLAIALSEEELKPLLFGAINIAACNAPSLSVVSGPFDDIDLFVGKLKSMSIESKKLHTSHAFHSSMMDPVLQPFGELFTTITTKAPVIPFISSLTGSLIDQHEATTAEYWKQQLRNTVQFSKGIKALNDGSNQIFLEVGPGTILTTSALKQINPQNSNASVINSFPHAQQNQSALESIITTLGKLWLHGVNIDWNNFYKDETRRRVSLPAYPFERKKYWIEAPAHPGEEQNDLPITNLTGVPLQPTAELEQPPAFTDDNSHRRTLLKNLLFKNSGIEINDENFIQSFIELGFDSLSLSQIAIEIEKALKVKVRFRQLLEELYSPEILMDYLFSQSNQTTSE